MGKNGQFLRQELCASSGITLVLLVLLSYEHVPRNRCWSGWRFSSHSADELL